MNDTSVKRKFDGEKADESRVKLQKTFEKMQDNLYRVGKCVELSKTVISECCHKLQELHSQVGELETILKETIGDDERRSLDTSEEIKEKNQLHKITDNNEEITAEGIEKSDDFGKTSGTNNYANERKKQKTNPENDAGCFITHQISDEGSFVTQQTNDEGSFITQQTNYECTPGPSQETSIEENNRPHSQDEEIMIEKEVIEIMIEKEVMDITETYFADDAVENALRNAEGVLSAQELKSFLYLTYEVKDPVHLAKVSFTSNLDGLYNQLMTFHFLLKAENVAIEKERNISNSKRNLDVKVQSLIQKFQRVVNSNRNIRSEMPFVLFRRRVATQQLLRRFNK